MPAGADHPLGDGLRLPAALGLEAMAQVAGAVSGHDGVPDVHDGRFLAPVGVSRDGTSVLRVAARVLAGGAVAVTVRSAGPGLGVEHFQARFRYDGPDVEPGPPDEADDALPLEDPGGDGPSRDGQFGRHGGYRRVVARHVDADVAAVADVAWFAPSLPAGLVFGDVPTVVVEPEGTAVLPPASVPIPVALPVPAAAGHGAGGWGPGRAGAPAPRAHRRGPGAGPRPAGRRPGLDGGPALSASHGAG